MSNPTFSEDEVRKFEESIDIHISKGFSQVSISTGIIPKELSRFQCYLAFYYRTGSFSPSGNVKNYLVAKKGKKLRKIENYSAFNY
jgi:hypothetical protein